MAPGRSYHAGLSPALLVPLNETVERPTGLDVADEKIEELIVAHLDSHGVAVEPIDRNEYRRATRNALRNARDAMLSGESGTVSQDVEFTDLIPHLFAELETEAAIVILPNVVMRDGEATGGRSVRWDGVKRRDTGTNMQLTGTQGVASIYVMIYDREGTRLFSAYGGLDLLFRINMKKKKFELIEDRLQDEENLREGVCIGFHPFFGEEEEC